MNKHRFLLNADAGAAGASSPAAPVSSSPGESSSPAPSGSPAGDSGSLLHGHAPTPTPGAPTSWVNDKGEFTDGWLDRLPAELQNGKSIYGQFKDLTGVLKTLESQQRLLGKKADAVLVPGKDATPEERKAFYAKLGVPESVDEYKIRPEGLDKDAPWDDSFAKEVAAMAHEDGVHPKTLDKIFSKYAEYAKTQATAEAQAVQVKLEASRKELAEEFGDKFERNMMKATRYAQSKGVDLSTEGLRDPNIVRLLVRAADDVADDKMVNGDVAGTYMVGSTKARDIMTNPANPLHDRYAKGDKQVASMVTDLLKNG
jgi:hypothetical protein